MVIATYDSQGRPCAATVSWGGICSSDPPSLAFSLRKTRYTYKNLLERRQFTINVPSQDYVAAIDYLGMVSSRREDKFQQTGLTALACPGTDAPYIKEFPFFLACRLTTTLEIGVHTQFIGEIVDVQVRDDLPAEACPPLSLVKPILYAPGEQGYYGSGSFLGKAFSVGKVFLTPEG
jgi:flavin reductase (DIM6/NTAB) family NADH-FMN oxidoreductase RutF